MKRVDCECCGREFITSDDDEENLCDSCVRHQFED